MQKPKIDFRFLWVLLGIEMLFLLGFVAPFLVGRYCGYGWGLLAAIADILCWFYLNLKYVSKKQLAFSTRAIWLLGLVYLIAVAIFEFTHLSH